MSNELVKFIIELANDIRDLNDCFPAGMSGPNVECYNKALLDVTGILVGKLSDMVGVSLIHDEIIK